MCWGATKKSLKPYCFPLLENWRDSSGVNRTIQWDRRKTVSEGWCCGTTIKTNISPELCLESNYTEVGGGRQWLWCGGLIRFSRCWRATWEQDITRGQETPAIPKRRPLRFIEIVVKSARDIGDSFRVLHRRRQFNLHAILVYWNANRVTIRSSLFSPWGTMLLIKQQTRVELLRKDSFALQWQKYLRRSCCARFHSVTWSEMLRILLSLIYRITATLIFIQMIKRMMFWKWDIASCYLHRLNI